VDKVWAAEQTARLVWRLMHLARIRRELKPLKPSGWLNRALEEMTAQPTITRQPDGT